MFTSFSRADFYYAVNKETRRSRRTGVYLNIYGGNLAGRDLILFVMTEW